MPKKIKIKREVAELYVHFAIRYLATSMFSLYEPLYLFNLGFSLKIIIGYFILGLIVEIILYPLGAKVAVKYGFEHTMLFSTPLIIIFYITLFATSAVPQLIILAALFSGIEKATYWPAYHANMAYYSNKSSRGKEIGRVFLIAMAISILGPILGGLMIKISSFIALFVVVSIILFISIIPLFATKENFYPGKFLYCKAFKRLFLKENRKTIFSYLIFGEGAIAVVIWPIYIFNILEGYLLIGVVVSVSMLFSIIATWVIGKYADIKKKRKQVIKFGAIISIFVWIARIFVRGPLAIISTDTFYNISSNSLSIPIYTKVYDFASKTQRYMKTIILCEQTMNVGRIMMLLIALGILSVFDRVELTFIPAGLVSILYLFL